MINLDHIALWVCDLEATKDFFVRFFGAHANNMYHNPRTGLKSYFLSFGNDVRIEIMTRPEVVAQECSFYKTGYQHISFSIGDKKKVDELTNLLTDNGFSVLSGPRTTGDGYYESSISGPEGICIEITE